MSQAQPPVVVVTNDQLFKSVGLKLPKQTVKKVLSTLQKLRTDLDLTGLDFKQPVGALDTRTRTCRVDEFWRMVLVEAGRDTGGNRVIIAWDVMRHEDAYRWCEQNTFPTNPVLASAEAFNPVSAAAIGRVTDHLAAARPGGLLVPVSIDDSELTDLGIPAEVIRSIRMINDESLLEAFRGVMSAASFLALECLVSGMTVTETRAQIVAVHGSRETQGLVAEIQDLANATGSTDPSPLAFAATSSASGASLHVFDGDEDLERALQTPLELWRVYLHPQQRSAVARSYTGPARVTGGPGTGKSVIAIHRSIELARRLGPNERVLVTTYTRNLADHLRRCITRLADDNIAARIVVDNVDAAVRASYEEAFGRKVYLVRDQDMTTWWEASSADATSRFTAEFLASEWRDVIEAQHIESAEAYLAADRRGRGTALLPAARREVWAAMDSVRTRLAAKKALTLSLAADAAAAAQRTTYRHVIIDEAQDLTPAHWRFLRSLVPPGTDDLFIAGDGHQRIYASQFSLSSLGIETRGRSTNLTLSYRSTRQILTWADQIMDETLVLGLDDEREALDGSTSLLAGREPALVGFDTTSEENAAVAQVVSDWLSDGVAAEDIAVVARTRFACGLVLRALAAAGVAAVEMTASAEPGAGVRIGTMHRMKGLEFRCVVVCDVNAKQLPHARAVATAEDDGARQAVYQQERSLLYVACTRPREQLVVTWSGAKSPFLPEPRDAARHATVELAS